MTSEEILATQSHRPFPPPNSPWIFRQEWHNLLFAHWALQAEHVRAIVPQQLQLDTWEGKAYVGVVPFLLRNMSPRGVPPMPVISHFAEINVRTYVTYKGIPGVYFFSLDAANLSAVLGARFAYALPYYHAKFRVRVEGDQVRYQSRRLQRPGPAEFEGDYRPVGQMIPWRSPSETLERFVSERYCLYAVTERHVYRTHVHHAPWPLQPAEAMIQANTMSEPLGLKLDGAPLLHYSKFVKVLTWLPETVG
jgi:uncharacterized protein YqjF (DUF2071 family)